MTADLRSASHPAALAALLALAVLLLPAPATGQQPPPAAQQGAQPPAEEGGVVVELLPGQRPQLRLAFPELERDGNLVGESLAAAEELEATLRADLETTRVFNIQGPWAFTVLELTGERQRDFELYRSLGNELLLSGTVRRDGDRLVFEASVFDLKSGEPVVGKRYRGGFGLARRIAHTFADVVLQYLTGRRGIALTNIAFVSDRDQQGRKEIYIMDYDGYGQRRVSAHRSTSMSPAWTPDGGGLAYTSFFGGSPGVYMADLGSGNKRPIHTEGRFNVSPSVSPDGRRVAFARSVDGNVDVYTTSLSGSDMRRLTRTGSIDTNPAWSPQGGEIAFTSSRAGGPQIYLMDPEGTNVRRLTFEGPYNDNAAWSPDGTKIAYSSRREGGRFQIAVTDVVTLETKLLTNGAGNHEDPTFSPDGRRIAFVRQVRGSKQIWVMDADDGSNQTQLTEGGNNESPNWSPYPP